MALALGELRGVRAGPGHEHRAVRGVLRRERQCGQAERVREDRRDARVAVGHLDLAVDPHQTAFAERVRDGDGGAEGDTFPGGGEGAGEAGHDLHLQYRLAGREEVDGAGQGVEVVQHRGEGEGEQGVAGRGGVRGRGVVGHADHLLPSPPHPASPTGLRPARRGAEPPGTPRGSGCGKPRMCRRGCTSAPYAL